MFVRFVLTVLLIFLAYTVLNAVLRLFIGHSPTRTTEDSADQMVPCVFCGTYVPQSDAIRKKKHGKVFYLCDEKCLKEYNEKRQ